MYVRWNRRKRIKKIEWVMKEGDYMYAVLVETHRIDGKPRQKTIKYLGGVGENNPSAFRRMRFWEKAEKELASLNLDPAARDKIIAILGKKVPKPSEDDVAGWREARMQMLRRQEERISGGRR
jgi:hypothetical protein